MDAKRSQSSFLSLGVWSDLLLSTSMNLYAAVITTLRFDAPAAARRLRCRQWRLTICPGLNQSRRRTRIGARMDPAVCGSLQSSTRQRETSAIRLIATSKPSALVLEGTE